MRFALRVLLVAASPIVWGQTGSAQVTDSTRSITGAMVSGVVHDSIARAPRAGAWVQLAASTGGAADLRRRRRGGDLPLRQVRGPHRRHRDRRSAGVPRAGTTARGHLALRAEPRHTSTIAIEFPIAIVQWGVRSAEVQAAKADQERVASTSRVTREQTVQDAHFAALQLGLSRRQLLACVLQAASPHAVRLCDERADSIVVVTGGRSDRRAIFPDSGSRRRFWVTYH
jgi:hypothetical protein